MNKNSMQLALSLAIFGSASFALHAGENNRLTHLQRTDAYYPSQGTFRPPAKAG